MTAAIAETRWQEAQHSEAYFWEGLTLGVLLRICGDLRAQIDKLPAERQSTLFAGKRVLEIGCGPLGLALPCFSPSAGEIAELVKLDPLPRLDLDRLPAAKDPLAEPFLSWVKARAGQGRYLQLSGEAFEERESFDTAISHNVLDHVRDPGAILDNAYAALKPGGTLLLWVDCMSWAGRWRFEQVVRRRQPDSILVKAHPFTFLPPQIEALLRDSGFRDIEVEGAPQGARRWFARQTRPLFIARKPA